MENLPSFSQEEEDLFLASCYALVYEDEQTYKSINSSFDYGQQLILIEKDLRRLASSNHHSTTNYETLIRLRNSIGEIQRNFPLSSFSPYIDLYFETDKLCRANDKNSNEFLDQLKHALTQTEFKKNIINKRKAVSKNKQSLMRYIEALFEYRARLLVIRVDLGYKRDNSGFINISKSERIDLLDGIKNKEVLEKWSIQVRQHRDDLIKILKKKYKNDLVGYVWKLEYGADKAFHYHTIFFLDGNYHNRDVLIAKEIGELWTTKVTNIQETQGIYWNCNARKNDFRKYDRIATGMIHYKDKRQRENLELMAEYLIKPDYFVRTALPDKARTFGKGERPTKLKSGRPRE